MRKHFHSPSKWEKKVGYARAVRVDCFIEVSGTTATDGEGKTIEEGNAYGQARYVFQKIARAIEGLGGKLSDVTRTRMYVKNIDDWEEISQAHCEFFGEIKPAATMIEVSRFISPGILVEIEAQAILESGDIL